MKQKRGMKAYMGMLLAVLLLVLLLPMPVFAKEGEGKLIITLEHDTDAPMKGAEITVYQIASGVPAGDGYRYTLTDGFLNSGFSLGAKDYAPWVDPLLVYVEQNALKGQITHTDGFGIASVDGLTPGVYLVAQTNRTQGHFAFTPAIVTLPYMDGETAHFTVTLDPKMERLSTEPPPYVAFGVRKVWKPAVPKDAAPITVHLLQDTKIYDIVSLTEENNWQYSWAQLPYGYRYRVVEDVPAGFAAAYQYGSDAAVITNTDLTPPPKEDELLQTGYDYTLTVILAAAGAVLMLLCILLLRRKKALYVMLFAAVLCLGAAGGTLVMQQMEGEQAREAARHVLSVMDEAKTEESVFTDDSLPMDVRSMAVKNIDGRSYIGVLSAPGIDLTVPVLQNSSMSELNTAPGRQFGSLFTDDMVIAGHNYDAHFGHLRKLKRGDALYFTDVSGVEYGYTVADVLEIAPNAVSAVKESGYPLVLYTCTPSGRGRVAVYCDRL